MKVLSVFDGISCGRYALEERCGFKITRYVASEIDKYASRIAALNFLDTEHVGDVTKVNGYDYLGFDLLIGGSPCQGFSFAGKQLNFEDPRSKLFFEFVRLKNEMKPKYFFLENVVMKKEYQDVISSYLGVQPVMLNSSVISAQSRKRLYWTNIPGYTPPKDKGVVISDILEPCVDDKYYHSESAINYMNRATKDGRNHWDFGHHSDTNKLKSACISLGFAKGVPYNVLIQRDKVNQINPYSGCSTNQPKMQHRIYHSAYKATALTASHSSRLVVYPDKKDLIRRLTPIECERLQTLPDNYTKGVSNFQRYKMLGNGWNIDAVAQWFQHLPYERTRPLTDQEIDTVILGL